ncbi:MAG: DUF3179 domain-containing (seleno)protein, partial [Pirellulaceae bacterium]|nr:DUF3179 domain-containing (seleno)protein [Pirellulaceae bacterium]
RVVAWLRSNHGGGAIPLRHFLSSSRVVNDTYGIFFYDPDGGYVAAFERSRGYKHTYEFHGWRNGVMVVKANDGSLVSALTGEVFAGPRKGTRLKRIPNLVTDWRQWLKLHPKSVAYRMYDGKKFLPTPLPTSLSKNAKQSMSKVDSRLAPTAAVLGVGHGEKGKAYALGGAGDRRVIADKVDDQPIVIFWSAATKTAVAYSSALGKQRLTFAPDKDSNPVTFTDRETGSQWTLAGRAVSGQLSGKELKWVDSIQCNWYAWSAEHPETELAAAK